MSARSYKNIGRLNIAMDNAGGMRGIEGVRDIDAKREKQRNFQRTARDSVLERSPIQKFHRDKGVALLLADVMNGADVGVIQRGSRLCFPLEASERLRIASDIVGQKLECDKAVKTSVLSLINHAHSATTQLL